MDETEGGTHAKIERGWAAGQVALTGAEPNTAVEVYGDKLGLRLIGRFPPGLAFFDIGSTRLMITGVEQESKIRNSTLYFNVPDIHINYD